MSERNLAKKRSADELHEASLDASKMAALSLDEVIGEESPEDIIARELSHSTVDEERAAKRILAADSGRSMSRVLFITRQTTYFEPASKDMKTMLSLAAYFDEVHILVLTPGVRKERTERFADNLWVYQVHASFWWQLPWAARSKAHEQLSFTDGFRPDLVVALDPFESGLAAQLIGKKFNRAVQVQVHERFTSTAFKNAAPANTWRVRLARYVIRRSKSVRAGSDKIHALLQTIVRKNTDVRMLPRFYNFAGFKDAKPSFDIHDRYTDFVFIMLTFGELTADSPLHDVFSAVNTLLHNPRVGLVVVGDGPAKKLFTEKVELLGIKKNVVFLGQTDDLVSYLKTADVLLETRESRESEELVLRSAAAGLPLIAYATELRSDLFEDGVSASIVEPGDIHTLEKETKHFLNNQTLRIQYRDAAQQIVTQRISEDETTYYRALRDSIELALVPQKELQAEEQNNTKT